MIMSMSSLARVYREEGRFREAESLARQIVFLLEKTVGTEHLDLASPLNILADVCQAQRRYSEAETLYRRALAMNENFLGPDHLDTGKIVNGLGTLYFEQRNYGKAETFVPARPGHQREVSRDRIILPLPRLVNNLGQVFLLQHRYADAEPLFRRALEIREARLGKQHPDVATTLNDYASLLRKTNRKSQAQEMSVRANPILANNRTAKLANQSVHVKALVDPSQDKAK